MIIALANLTASSQGHAAEVVARQRQVEADCVIYGTRIGAPYVGKIETIMTKAGTPRRIGVLNMTKEGLEAFMRQFGSDIGSDIERFGAFQLRAPYTVFLATIEDRQGMTGSMIGYGHGDVGDEMAKTKFDVPVACDLKSRD